MEIINNTKSYDYQPSAALRRYVQALLSDEVKGNKTLAEQVSGVRRQRFYYNMTKPEFRQWFNDECNIVLLINRARVDFFLLSMIEKGNVVAMRTYYELIGVLKNKIERSGGVESQDTKLEVKVYPQYNTVYADVIPENADEQLTNRKGICAVES